jgi:hypothetical protein
MATRGDAQVNNPESKSAGSARLSGIRSDSSARPAMTNTARARRLFAKVFIVSVVAVMQSVVLSRLVQTLYRRRQTPNSSGE